MLFQTGSASHDSFRIAITESNLMKEVKNKSQKPGLNVNDLQKQINQLRDPNHDRWQVCRGNDLVETLSYGLIHAIGSQKSAEVTVENLERSLRLAYQSSYFSQTKLYSDLEHWQHQNSYQILKS